MRLKARLRLRRPIRAHFNKILRLGLLTAQCFISQCPAWWISIPIGITSLHHRRGRLPQHFPVRLSDCVRLLSLKCLYYSKDWGEAPGAPSRPTTTAGLHGGKLANHTTACFCGLCLIFAFTGLGHVQTSARSHLVGLSEALNELGTICSDCAQV
jgi:hypothetical protein